MVHLLSKFCIILGFVVIENLFFLRLEYEQNRDMGSRIKELESSISALENDLDRIQERETEAKSSAEKAISEIKHWNEEVEGTTLLFFFWAS